MEERSYRATGEGDAELVRRWAEHYGVRLNSVEVAPGKFGLGPRLTITATASPEVSQKFWEELDRVLKPRFSLLDLLGP
jgi:hypothetical protein